MFLYMNNYIISVMVVQVDFLGRDCLKVLRIVALNAPYLREIAESTNLAPSSAHKILTRLKLNRIVLEKKKKNRSYFSLNPDSVIGREAVRLMFVSAVLGSKAFRKLISLGPKRVYLFGSASKGTITPKSDIDLAAFFEKKPNTHKVSEIKRLFSEEFLKDTDLFILSDKKSSSSNNEKTETLKAIENSVLLYGSS